MPFYELLCIITPRATRFQLFYVSKKFILFKNFFVRLSRTKNTLQIETNFVSEEHNCLLFKEFTSRSHCTWAHLSYPSLYGLRLMHTCRAMRNNFYSTHTYTHKYIYNHTSWLVEVWVPSMYIQSAYVYIEPQICKGISSSSNSKNSHKHL